MKNNLLKLTLSLFAVLLGILASAQDDYVLQTEEDGVKVYTKWGRESFFKKNSPKVLLVWVENTTDNDVIYEIGTDFFFETTLSETFPEQEFCVKSGKSRKGKLDGIYYKSCQLTNEQLLSEDFDYTINFNIVEANADCGSYEQAED